MCLPGDINGMAAKNVSETFTDLFGQEVRIGEIVVHNEPGLNLLVVSKVLAITGRGVKVQAIYTSSKASPHGVATGRWGRGIDEVPPYTIKDHTRIVRAPEVAQEHKDLPVNWLRNILGGDTPGVVGTAR